MKKIVGLIVAILLLFSFRIILIGFGLLVAAFIHAGAQHNNELVIKGCEISIQNGASLVVQGDFRIMNSGALLRNDGLLETQGNMYSDTNFQQKGSGTTRLFNRSVNTSETQFIQGSFAVRGGTSQIDNNDGSFYSLELANSRGIVWLNGTGLVADVRNSVNFSPLGTGTPVNRIITHNPASIPSNGSAYAATFGMMNTTGTLVNFLNNSVTSNGNNTAIDNGYIQGKLRRAISPMGGNYGFVLGTQPGITATDARGIQYASLDFSANNYDVFTGSFNPASPNVIFGAANDCGYYINYFGGSDHGEWLFSPFTIGSGNYSFSMWPQNYSSFAQPTYVVTQNDAMMGTPNDCGPSVTGLSRRGFYGGGFFGFAGGSTPLGPNTLILDAKSNENQSIQLNWSNENKQTNSHYEIERITGESDFLNLGFQVEDEFFEDKNVFPGINYYYRIKAIGLDGEINYSNTSEALLYNASFSGNTVTVFPNPSTGGKVNFEWTSRISENIRIAINDLNGKLILQTEIQTEKGKNTTQINTETWASGMYFFAISGNNTLTGKFLVK